MKSKNVWLAAVLYLFTACSSPENKPASLTTTMPEAKETREDGKKLFGDKCAACHGLDGKAGIANAADLQTSPLDRNSILEVVVRGRNNMPAFTDQLNPQELEQVTIYVLALKSKH